MSEDYDPTADFAGSLDECYRAIRDRVAAGGASWTPPGGGGLMSELLLDGRVELYAGDCLAVLPTLPENNIDACVTDPPYHLTSIVKRFGADNAAPAKSNGATGFYARASSGFMGKQWDGGDTAFRLEVWREVYRVLKPGAHLVAFGGTRTYHRMACAIEDAGFEIRDCIQWLYGSGFPKSLDISKQIDKAAGAKRDKIVKPNPPAYQRSIGNMRPWMEDKGHLVDGDEPITAEAARWIGFATALKPACELIVLARKPLSEKTVAANVLRWGTGAINIDGCRVEFCGANDAAAAARAIGFDRSRARGTLAQSNSIGKESRDGTNSYNPLALNGRWPANVCHDGSDEVLAAFPETASGSRSGEYANGTFSSGIVSRELIGDSGSAARFFYTAKADSDDRIGSKHPTVKPLDLVQWLVRLITPPKGLVLDPFAGTGTTGEAAFREGARAVLIEREAEYQDDIRRRMKLALGGPDERARESIKARGRTADPGPLFSFGEAAE